MKIEESLRRLIDEKRELDERLGKLTAFFATYRFDSLDDGEKSRMERQWQVMNQYSQILCDRIAFKFRIN